VFGRPEDHTGLGPLISQGAPEKVLGYYRKAVEEGATVVTGGGVPDMPAELKEGAWVQPTIWTGLPETAAVVREEIFGPCCHIRPFDSENEVAWPTTPTTASPPVWTKDVTRAHRVAAARSGHGVDQQLVPARPAHAFGGAKQSGIGREGGCIRWSSTPSCATSA
jgi:aminomuconate-semialdehyde/2-hydroxymuconate-6-semialdehyde dehydrogenase